MTVPASRPRSGHSAEHQPLSRSPAPQPATSHSGAVRPTSDRNPIVGAFRLTRPLSGIPGTMTTLLARRGVEWRCLRHCRRGPDDDRQSRRARRGWRRVTCGRRRRDGRQSVSACCEGVLNYRRCPGIDHTAYPRSAVTAPTGRRRPGRRRDDEGVRWRDEAERRGDDMDRRGNKERWETRWRVGDEKKRRKDELKKYGGDKDSEKR